MEWTTSPNIHLSTIWNKNSHLTIDSSYFAYFDFEYYNNSSRGVGNLVEATMKSNAAPLLHDILKLRE